MSVLTVNAVTPVLFVVSHWEEVLKVPYLYISNKPSVHTLMFPQYSIWFLGSTIKQLLQSSLDPLFPPTGKPTVAVA